MKSPGPWKIKWVYKPVVHGLALIPFVVLIYGFSIDDLGVNPVETMTHTTGEWSLRILLVSLFITPLARITRSGWLVQFRRMVGLYAFFYALMHFLVFLLFDLSLDFSFLVEEIIERPYITVGFSSLVILLALASTSPIIVRQKMGKNWDRLHKLVYVSAILAVIHFLWITKIDDSEPLVYGAILIVLLGYRLLRKGLTRKARPPEGGVV